MITLQDLEHTSTKTSLKQYWEGYTEMYGSEPDHGRRHPDTIESRVLTCEEVNKFYADLTAERTMPEQEVLALGNNARRNQMLVFGVTIVANDTHFFLTDDCQFGWEIWRCAGMLSFTYGGGLPYHVAPRTKFPDGVLLKVEDLISIFEDGKTQLNSNEELLHYLNSI